MLVSLLALSGILQTLPCEFVIDLGTKPIPDKPSLTFTFTARDGTVDTFMFEGNDDDPEAILVLIDSSVEDGETPFLIRRGKPGEFIVRGTRKSPMKSVKIESTGWKPKVRRVLLLPKPKK